MFNKKIGIISILIILLFTLSAVSATDNYTDEVVSAEPSNETLNAYIPYTFTEMQKLINNAESGSEINFDQDVIYDDGFSSDGITIDKPLTINGNNHLVQSSSKSRVFNLKSDNITIKNVRFVNSISDISIESGAAVFNNGSNCHIDSCNFTGFSTSTTGGAIYNKGETFVISNCNFIDCHSPTGGAFCCDGESSTVYNCSFLRCTASNIGGAVIWVGGKGKLYNCSFVNCSMYKYDSHQLNYGGAISWNGDDGVVYDTYFTECSTPYGNGGGIYWNGNNGVLYNTHFINCSTTYDYGGGGIYWNGANGVVSNTYFINCSSTNGGGGGIYWNGNNGVVSNTNFIHCSSIQWHGGGIYWTGLNGTVYNSNFINCSATLERADGADSVGGGLISWEESEDFYINNCTFIHCSADVGAGVYMKGAHVCLNNTTFKGNIARENENYYVLNSNVTNAIILNTSTVFIFENLNTVYGIPANLTITLKSEFEDILKGQTLTILFNSEEYTLKTDSNGRVEFPIPTNQSVKTYETNISFNGSGQYEASNITVSITVNKRNTNISVEYNNNTMKIIAVLTDALSGDPINATGISVDFEGMIKNATTDKEGKITVSTSDLNPGKYNVTISSDGDSYHDHVSDTIDIIITGNSNIIAVYDEDEMEIIATLVDNITGKAIGDANLSLTVDYLRKNITTDSNGRINVSADQLIPGSYIACIVFEGNDIYFASNTTFNITKHRYNTSLISKSVVFVYNSGGKLIATLKDMDDKPISMAEITASWDDISINLLSDDDGKVYLSTDSLLPGRYEVNFAFKGNNIFLNSNTSAGINIEKISTNLTSSDVVCDYNSGKKLTAVLKDENGNAISGAEITVKLGGIDVNLISDDNGEVYLSTDALTPGSYNASVLFEGGNIYTASNTTAEVIVNSVFSKISTNIISNVVTTFYGSNSYLTITLKDNAGNTVGGVPLSVVLNGKTLTQNTDKNGQVKISVGNLAPKIYVGEISFNGNDIYYKSSKYVNVIVKVASSKITAKNKKFKKSKKTKKYKIALKNGNGEAIKKVKVTLKLKGKTYSTKTNSKGKATFKITKLKKKGEFKAVIKFKGNSYYKSSTKKVKITVK